MKKNIIKTAIFAMICSFVTCKPQQDTPQPAKPVADINALFSSVAKISPATMATLSDNPLNSSVTTNQTGTNGSPYQCSEQKFSLTNGMDKVIALNPNVSALFTGNIVQGKYVNAGTLTSSVLTSMREDVTVTITGLSGIANASRKVKPTLDQIEKARKEILASSSNIKVLAQIDYQKKVGYSLAQSMLSFGINANWGGGSVGGGFRNSNKVEEQSIYIYFMQKYYDLAMNDPQSPADFFASSTKVSDLQSIMQQGNPLCYVSSVAYGRILIAKITSEKSISDIEKAANASYGLLKGGLGISANITSSDRSVLEKSQIDLFVLGGDATDVAKITSGTANGLDVMNNIANYIQNSANKPEFALPISYVVKYLDNTPFFVGATTEYTKKDCSLSANAFQNIDIVLRNFYIRNSCDAGTGEGEFYYEITVTASDGTNKSVVVPCSSNPFKRLNNTFIEISQIVPIKLLKQDNQSFAVSAKLYEDDTSLGSCSLTEREVLDFGKITFSYPWTIANTATYIDPQTNESWYVRRVPLRENSCDAQFQYQIKLK